MGCKAVIAACFRAAIQREHATDITFRRIYIREHASYDGACYRGEVAVKGQGKERKGSR